ncbi:hypothetical protein WICPIJ_002024 [Wickerhamomyces pijperi]|uniref:Uncharacterized protein n=1 Tax=Wickerhamomyces pijperi TaxID=599730 RepID=A0A9P8QCK2_WICPI|nr:hypothetical protein WICPIJ_002024 [Wickerhamomyces pijperi]
MINVFKWKIFPVQTPASMITVRNQSSLPVVCITPYVGESNGKELTRWFSDLVILMILSRCLRFTNDGSGIVNETGYDKELAY